MQFDLATPRGAQGLVVMIHGTGESKDWAFFPWLAEVFCDARLAVCRFNMSRADDLARVVRQCQTRLALPTFLFAHGDGAAAAIAMAPDIPNLRGIVLWSAGESDASRLTIPLLAINSGAIDGQDVSRVMIFGADSKFNATDPLGRVPRELMLAADVTARFITAYST